jgi:hypothetical protein
MVWLWFRLWLAVTSGEKNNPKSFMPTLNKSRDIWLDFLSASHSLTASSTTTTTINHLDNHNNGHNNGRGYHNSNSSSINGNGSNGSNGSRSLARDATRLELHVCFLVLFLFILLC